MKNFFQFIFAIVGISIGLGGTLAIASIGEVVYTDPDTGQVPPVQIPPTVVAYPRATLTQNATGTNTVPATAIGTATPAASAIVMSQTNSKIDVNWLPSSVPTGTGSVYRYAQWASGGTTLTSTRLWESPTGGLRHDAELSAGTREFTTFGGPYAGTGALIAMIRTRGSAPGSWSPTLANDLIGGFTFWGTGTGNYAVAAGSILAYATANALADAQPLRLVMRTMNAAGAYNANQLALESDGSVTSSGPMAATNQVDCPAPMRCNGTSTASLLQTSTLTLSVATGTNSSTVARGDDGTSAHSLTVEGNAWFRTDTSTATQGTVSLNQNATLVVSQTTTSTATATASVTNTISVSPGLNLTTGTNTVTNTTAQISLNPQINLSAMLYCSGCQLSGTGTGTATSMAISQSPEIIVTPASVGALPASSVSGTNNYLAKFGATGATLGNSVATESGTSIQAPQFYGTTIGGGSVAGLMSQTLAIYYPSGAADQKLWDFNGQDGVFQWRAVNDANSAANTFFRVYRTGITVGNIEFPTGTVNIGSANQFQVPTTGIPSAPSYVIRGSTSGAVTHGAAATTATYSLLAPSTAPGAGQGIVYPSGGGQGTWVTPMVADGSTGTGCTEINAVGGKVVGCSTTAHVAANAAITASGANYRIVQYDTKGLVTAGISATPANIGALAADGTTASGCTTINASAGKVTGCDTTARVPTTRNVYAGSGMSGGGALSADITLSIAGINDTQHGNRSGGSLHSVATTSVNGFMSSTDKTKLDGIASGATNTPLSSSTPKPPGFGTQSAGSSTSASRADHRHADSIDLNYTRNYAYDTEISLPSSETLLLEMPVYWANMPSSLAVYATWNYDNTAGARMNYCYMRAYTGSDRRGVQGSTLMFNTVTSTVYTDIDDVLEATSYEFTKPSGGSNGTRSLVQLYGYCTYNNDISLMGAHLHITAGNY